ncbi:MAG TPA: cupredoxin domain-containing protein [Candidatus Nanoarchaeia archaeon]|nr:cupredoxin domain-containing protein [Candidatus Nanoarchaeia archaeon]
MEQKQIDELEDSYTGEEFIDEDDLEQLQVEKKSGATSKRGRPSKVVKVIKSSANKTTANKATANKKAEEILEEVKVTPLKEEHHSKKETNVNALKTKEEPKFEESSPAYDPWDDDEEPASGGFFWKVLTGILVILLVVSVFTQGFNFGEEPVTGAAALSISEAENKALDYVNNNLLQSPFVAELEESADVGNLYQVTLSVAGQKVDSYITKDGTLFFPQGFDTSVGLSAKSGKADSSDLEPETAAEADAAEPAAPSAEPTEATETAATEEAAEVAETEAEPVAPIGETKEFTLDAKKWLFNPNELVVNQGDKVKLTITSSDLVFTFAIPEFGVEKEVSGTALVEFTADKTGKFGFECSSCEDWRGMAGTLTVN